MKEMLHPTLCLIVLTYTSVITACVYSQSYWLDAASEPWPGNAIYPLSEPVCGLSWRTLMHLNTSQVKDPDATYWLLAFHQLCTVTLNLQIQQPGSSIVPPSAALSSLVILDSMQRMCNNMSGWVLETALDAVMSAHLSTIIQFNHAGDPCDLVSALPFSFTQSPQLFFLGYNETELGEAKRQAEVINHIYKVQTLLVVLCSLAIFFIIALVIYCIMLRNAGRRYFCCRESFEGGELYIVNTGMEDISFDDGGCSDDMISMRSFVPKEKEH